MNGSLPTGASAPTAGASDAGAAGGLRTLAAAYAFGLGNDPDVDNVLVGSYFNVDFDEDGHVAILQNVVDDGSGADANPPITSRRWFANSAAAGLIEDYRVRYEDGTNITAGLQEKFTVEDADGDARLYMDRRTGLSTGAVQTAYRPTFAGGTTTHEQLDMLGFHQDSMYAVHGRDGNGVLWHRAQMTDTVRELFAHVTQMDSEGGGNPADGSIVSWAVTGPSASIGLGTQLTRVRTVLDTGNFGSEQADAHLELMAASIADGDVVTGLSVYADRIAVPGTITQTGFIVPVVLRTALNDNLLATGVRSFVGTPAAPAGKKFHSLGRFGIEMATKTGTATGNMTVDFQINGVAVGATGFTFASATINGLPGTLTTYFSNSVAGVPGGTGADLSAFPLDVNVTAALGGLSALTGNFVLFGYFA